MKREQGKYKWLVLMVTFLSQAFTYGITYSVGVLYKDWTSYFDSSASFLSLVGSAPTAVSCLCAKSFWSSSKFSRFEIFLAIFFINYFEGPFYGFLLSHFTCRSCGALGGLLMAVGMSSSFLVENVLELFVTFGIITGMGLGLHFYASCTMINEYFFENRLLAEGIVGGGIGLGTFLFSMFQQYLLHSFTWKGAMLISGSIVLHLCLNSMFFISSSAISSHPLNLCKFKFGKENVSVTKQNFKDEEQNSKAEQLDINRERSSSFVKRSMRLWKNPLFLVIAASDLFSWLSIFIPYVHLVNRATLNGMDKDTAAWLSSTFGLASIVGRPATGYVSNYFRIHPQWCYCANQTILGLATFTSSFWSSSAGFFSYAALFGFLSNGYGFIKACAARLLGPECFADAFSWMLLIEGFGILCGTFLAGYIYDATLSYAWSFRFAGMLLLFSAFVFVLKPFAKRRQSRRNAATSRGMEAFCHNQEDKLFHLHNNNCDAKN